MSISESDVARLAPLLNHLTYQASACPHYELLSGALIWPDELPTERPLPDGWCAIRPLFRHRTCMIIGIPLEYSELWEVGKKSFPQWPGFRTDRCSPSNELKELYEQSSRSWDEFFERVDRGQFP